MKQSAIFHLGTENPAEAFVEKVNNSISPQVISMDAPLFKLCKLQMISDFKFKN